MIVCKKDLSGLEKDCIFCCLFRECLKSEGYCQKVKEVFDNNTKEFYLVEGSNLNCRKVKLNGNIIYDLENKIFLHAGLICLDFHENPKSYLISCEELSAVELTVLKCANELFINSLNFLKTKMDNFENIEHKLEIHLNDSLSELKDEIKHL